jgi:Ca2+-binding RTX toxin-like protein
LTFQYTVALSDPTGALTAAQSTAVLDNLRGALDIYSRHITGQGVLDVVVQVDFSGATVGSGASVVAVNTGATFNGKTVIYEGAVAELRSGTDPNGDAADLRINLPPSYLTNALWLDPDPTTRAATVAAGKFDAVTFFLHELGHGLGFNGRGDEATGVVSGGFVSTYDTFVQTQGGYPVFTGANAMAVYGGAVPLAAGQFNDYHHYGRLSADGLDDGLMEGSTSAASGGTADGGRWYLDQLDLAFFRDIGLTTVTTPIADTGGSRFTGFAANDTLSGGAGADTLSGGSGNDTLGGKAGDDRIDGGSGTNYLRGDEGNDSITGGSGFDDINGNAGNDTCVSGGGDDWVVGGKDNDSLVGSAGQNLVYGNLGNDTCDGGDGNDIVRGGQDNDSLNGGAGDDYVSGDKGSDTMTGGAGADSFHTFGDAGIDRVLDFSLTQGDRVQLDPGTQFTVSQVGADTVIDMTGGGQMVLVGVQMSALTPGWIFGA